MNAVFTWIAQNPAAFKGYLIAIIPLVSKGILAATGKVDDLGAWAGFVDMAVDLLVGALTTFGIGAGIVHTVRGPQLTSVEHVAAVVAALAPAPVTQAVEQVKTIVADVVAVKAPPVSEFPESHKF